MSAQAIPVSAMPVTAAPVADAAIPIIDLAGPAGSAGNAALAGPVGDACERFGFLIIGNHGIPAPVIESAFAASRAFFDLPLAEKSRYKPADGVSPRGYHALATRNLAKTLGVEAPPDLREQFFIGPLVSQAGAFAHIPAAAPFYVENIWPDRPASFRAALSAFYGGMGALAGRLMRIFALALDMPETFFDDKIDRHFSTCPSNHYPALAGEPLPGQLRAGAHTDFGSLTILAFDGAPDGLQARLADGRWVDVRPPPGHLVVNLGDMMQRWTNDRWHSTLHRVVNPPTAGQRQTMGYFLHPNYDAEVACLPSCHGPGRPARYPPIMAGEHMRVKLERRVDG